MMKRLLFGYIKQDSGATAIEYGLIVSFIAVLISVTVFAIGGDIKGFFNEILGYISSAHI